MFDWKQIAPKNFFFIWQNIREPFEKLSMSKLVAKAISAHANNDYEHIVVTLESKDH